MQAALYTLGCKVNQYETQAMEQELVRRGSKILRTPRPSHSVPRGSFRPVPESAHGTPIGDFIWS